VISVGLAFKGPIINKCIAQNVAFFNGPNVRYRWISVTSDARRIRRKSVGYYRSAFETPDEARESQVLQRAFDDLTTECRHLDGWSNDPVER
jgi:hypothetical protein